MSITNVIAMLGAIATFLFGMSTMTDGLEKLSSGRLERVLERLTSNVFKSVLLGAVVTGLIQSSAATTVMCVGFVNAGIMKLSQTVGIIMGANIGTTITAQLLRLGDISSDNLLLSLLKPSILGPFLAFVGILFYMFLKGGHKRILGQIAMGLGLLFIGMYTLETAVAPLQELPEFQALFTAFSNPLLGVAVGAIVTALIQSSSASMGILQAVSSTGIVSFNIAIPLIMGQNIGTCVTAVLSSVGASKNAKRTAMIHLFFNILGTAFFMIVLYAGNAIFRFPFWETAMSRGTIANLHSVFNIACTLILLPFHRQLVKLVEHIIPATEKERTSALSLIDERFLATPSVALEHAREVVVRMSELAHTDFLLSCGLLEKYDPKKRTELAENEDQIDACQTGLENYLLKLSGRNLSKEDNTRVTELLHTVTDFERIGDYAEDVADIATAMDERGIHFSASALRDIKALTAAVDAAISKTMECYRNRSYATAFEVEPIEEVVDLLRDTLRANHIERLKRGECTVDVGMQFGELLISLERISDHCSNVAVYILRETAPSGELVREDPHAYLHELHHGASAEYDRLYAQYQETFYLPLANAIGARIEETGGIQV